MDQFYHILLTAFGHCTHKAKCYKMTTLAITTKCDTDHNIALLSAAILSFTVRPMMLTVAISPLYWVALCWESKLSLLCRVPLCWMCRNAESCLWWVSLCWVSHYAHCFNKAQHAECHIILNVIIPIAVMLSVVYSEFHYAAYHIMLIVAMKLNMLSAILYWMSQ
jgi:hypothetical protein